MDFSPASPFSAWIRGNLQDAYSGLIAHDVDYLVYSIVAQTLYVIEEKRKAGARVGPASSVTFKAISDLLWSFRSTERSPRFGGCVLAYVLASQHIHNPTYQVKLGSAQNQSISLTQLEEMLANGTLDADDQWFERIIQSNKDRLWDCRGDPPIRKTEPERTGKRLSRVLSDVPGRLCVSHVDWFIINYCTGWMLILQEARSIERLLESDQSLSAFHRMLSEGSEMNRQLGYARNPASKAVYSYIGAFAISYTQNRGRITSFSLNDKLIPTEKLIKALNLNDDRSLQILEDYNGRR